MNKKNMNDFEFEDFEEELAEVEETEGDILYYETPTFEKKPNIIPNFVKTEIFFMKLIGFLIFFIFLLLSIFNIAKWSLTLIGFLFFAILYINSNLKKEIFLEKEYVVFSGIIYSIEEVLSFDIKNVKNAFKNRLYRIKIYNEEENKFLNILYKSTKVKNNIDIDDAITVYIKSDTPIYDEKYGPTIYSYLYVRFLPYEEENEESNSINTINDFLNFKK